MVGEVLKISIDQLDNDLRREHDTGSALHDCHLQNVSGSVECDFTRNGWNLADALWKMSSHDCGGGECCDVLGFCN